MKPKSAKRIGIRGLIVAWILGTSLSMAQTSPMPDTDRDGIPDAADPCPRTAPNSQLVVRGCSALDIVQDAEYITAHAMRDMPWLYATIKARKDGVQTAEILEEAERTLLSAAEQIENGQVLEGTRLHTEGLEQLVEAKQFLHALGDEAGRLALASQEKGAKEADVSAADLDEVEVRVRERDLDSIIAAVSAVNSDFQALSGQVTGITSARGVITLIDDAAHRMRLDSGHLTGLSPEARIDGTLATGLSVQVSGVAFADGTSLTTAGTSASKGKAYPATLTPCIELRFVPVQPLPPYTTLPYKRHHMAAYKYENFYQIERATGLAAETVSCVATDKRFSFNIKVEYVPKNQSSVKTKTLTEDLDPLADPVFLPSNIDHVAKLIVTTRVQDRVGSHGQTSFGDPQILTTNQYQIYCLKFGEFGSALYERTEFNLEGVPFDVARVTSVGANTQLRHDGALTFYGTGYRVLSNSSSSYPNKYQLMQGDPFAILTTDFYKDDLEHPLQSVGVDRPSGIAWPHAIGNHNGFEYSYTVTVPRIIRDRLDECDPKPNAYYKLPFSGGYPDWKVTQGNFGTVTHYGDSSYAFDFANFEGAPIYAARGGTVKDVVKDLTCNNWGLEGLLYCPGNHLIIRHEDGSESWYIHMPKNGVLPKKEDIVKRGQFVAVVGNTGHSSGPHLHFEVRNPGEPTHEIKFHAYWWPSNLSHPCHIPFKGSMEWSILE